MLVRTGALVGLCTGALTAAFVGIASIVTGNAAGVVTRLQFYILAGAVAFVGGLLVLEESRHGGQTVLTGATAAGVVGFLLLGLGSEGVLFALAEPEIVFSSSLFVYIVAAALIASGVGYWSVRNWQLVGQRMPNRGL